MERRDFIKRTAALASVTAISGLATAQTDAKSVAGVERLADAAVLVDDRFSDSRRFGAAMAARGAQVVSLSEDIGRLWYGGLREQCSRPGSFIAGLTLHTDLFVSQLFAREYGKTLTAFGEHDCRGRETLVHSLPTNVAMPLSDANDWPESIAAYLSATKRCAASRTAQATRIVRAADHPGSLFSWMIA
jgi:hypothetical protein